MTHQKTFTVTELTTYVKNLLEFDIRLSNLWLRGEISNVSKPTAGHLYFTLKDEQCVLKSVMFRSNFEKIPFDVRNGMEVLVRGRIGVYPKGGAYQCYIQEMFPQGIGSLELAFQQLKNSLAEEGLFDKKHKKMLPKIPQSIGLITSPGGSVVKDFIKVVRRRFPLVDIFLVPVTVQGNTASAEISKAIERLNNDFPVDIIVIARGGGSLEELWPFNSEAVARAIFASEIPIVSAIGHETDFTISDMTADLRAATPSAAGELVVPLIEALNTSVRQAEKQLYNSSNNLIQNHQNKLKNLEKGLRFAAKFFMDNQDRKLVNLSQRLHTLSPLQTLNRGYALCLDEYGKTIVDSDHVQIEQKVGIRLQKGFLACRVENKKEDIFDERVRRQHKKT